MLAKDFMLVCKREDLFKELLRARFVSGITLFHLPRDQLNSLLGQKGSSFGENG